MSHRCRRLLFGPPLGNWIAPQSAGAGEVEVPSPLVSPARLLSSRSEVNPIVSATVPIARSVPSTTRYAPGLNLTTTPGCTVSVTPGLMATEFLIQNVLPTTDPPGPQLWLVVSVEVMDTTCAAAGAAAAAASAAARARGRSRVDMGRPPKAWGCARVPRRLGRRNVGRTRVEKITDDARRRR